MSFSAESSDFGDHGKGEKRGVDKAELEKVHSANDWEGANLGDDDRRKKFLRLMGAKKKEHHGRFVIGENSSKHGRTDEETSRLNRQLEHQYRSGLDLKLSGAARHHSGLGFHDERSAPSSSTTAGTAAAPPAPTAAPTTAPTQGPTAATTVCHKDPPHKDADKPHDKDTKTHDDKPVQSKTQESEQTNGKERRSSESEKFKMNFVKASD